MDLSGFEVWIIIGLVLGVIASNLAVLKYSAKFKMPHLGDHKDKSIASGKNEDNNGDEHQDSNTHADHNISNADTSKKDNSSTKVD
ncbi:DUF2897 family protein [Shewanella sp. OMA3-2]|uniref:DUF2897 family protein n=1 Tax=Shewanella sp. OMA3-2 TaxID=2908650 RepID=UPI001F3ED34B|nr:DUF2897 family protein [Shewanella sp. OMA3-2]UJF20550.1 DUF2897 family protein [Shewanella sp. OMA3-2]